MKDRLKTLRENRDVARNVLLQTRRRMDDYLRSKALVREELEAAVRTRAESWRLVEIRREQVRIAEQRHAAARERLRAAQKSAEDLRKEHLEAIEAERQADERFLARVDEEGDGQGARAAYQAWVAADLREKDLAHRTAEAAAREPDARRTRDEAARDEAQAQVSENETSQVDRDRLTQLAAAYERYAAVDAQQTDLSRALVDADSTEARWAGVYSKFLDEIRE